MKIYGREEPEQPHTSLFLITRPPTTESDIRKPVRRLFFHRCLSWTHHFFLQNVSSRHTSLPFARLPLQHSSLTIEHRADDLCLVCPSSARLPHCSRTLPTVWLLRIIQRCFKVSTLQQEASTMCLSSQIPCSGILGGDLETIYSGCFYTTEVSRHYTKSSWNHPFWACLYHWSQQTPWTNNSPFPKGTKT